MKSLAKLILCPKEEDLGLLMLSVFNCCMWEDWKNRAGAGVGKGT